MNDIMYNACLFGRTYIASYLVSIIATYSILIFVCIFTWTGDEGISKFQWYYVIYPQCGWLLLIKLYHNEISQMIIALETNININGNSNNISDNNNNYRNIYYNYNDSQNDDNYDYEENLEAELRVNVEEDDNVLSRNVTQYYKRLFMYQCSAFVAALYAIFGYFYLLCNDVLVYPSTNHDDSSIWLWQSMYI